jgi:hypothetical protein
MSLGIARAIVHDSLFHQNAASLGGGLVIQSEMFTATQLHVRDNLAATAGGGLALQLASEWIRSPEVIDSIIEYVACRVCQSSRPIDVLMMVVVVVVVVACGAETTRCSLATVAESMYRHLMYALATNPSSGIKHHRQWCQATTACRQPLPLSGTVSTAVSPKYSTHLSTLRYKTILPPAAEASSSRRMLCRSDSDPVRKCCATKPQCSAAECSSRRIRCCPTMRRRHGCLVAIS